MLEADSRLGPYEVVELVGSGGMGEVYRSRDPRLGREVAIKVLRQEIADEARLRRFEQEARAAGVLNHPNILAVYDVGSYDGGVPYVVSVSHLVLFGVWPTRRSSQLRELGWIRSRDLRPFDPSPAPGCVNSYWRRSQRFWIVDLKA